MNLPTNFGSSTRSTQIKDLCTPMEDLVDNYKSHANQQKNNQKLFNEMYTLSEGGN